MNKKIGILYSTVDGHSLKISKKIAAYLQKQGYQTEIHNINTFSGTISDYSKLIIAASLRYGKHNKKVTQFINKNKEELSKIYTAFFSVNLVARKDGKNQFHNNPYVVKYFNKINWQPNVIDVFAGKLDYQAYSLFDKLMIKLIMKITKGPTKSDKPIEFTDWDRVEAFAKTVSEG